MTREQTAISVRMPQPTSLATAIQIYYKYTEIGNAEITDLFGVNGQTVLKLKRLAKEQMDDNGVPSWNALKVNTKCAYQSWGLDIDDLEKRYEKLQKLAV